MPRKKRIHEEKKKMILKKSKGYKRIKWEENKNEEREFKGEEKKLAYGSKAWRTTCWNNFGYATILEFRW